LGHYVNRTYDPLGRVTLETTETGQRGITTDEAGRLILLGWDGGPNIAYDRLVTGEVWRMRENPAYANYTLATFAYDDQGRRTSLTRGNGASTTYGYDAVSRLTQLVQNLNGTSNDLILDFTYNPAGEIVTNTRSNDAYSFTGHANASVADTINGLNQVTQRGSTGVSRDSRGNTTAIGSTSYAYTTEDRLSTGGAATLTYNPEGTLLGEAGAANRRFDTLGGDIIAERDGAGNRLRRFVPGPGVDEHIVWYEGSDLGTRRYHHQDERGSVIAVSDASGNLVGSVNRYDEYGVPQGTLTGRFGYTGQPWIPEAGLYHYRARAYNPAMGRFMQTDPIGFGGGMNIYAYVGNNPVNRSDPTGLDCPESCPTVTGNRDPRCDDEGAWWDADPRHKMRCDQGGLILTFFAMGTGSVGVGSGSDGGSQTGELPPGACYGPPMGPRGIDARTMVNELLNNLVQVRRAQEEHWFSGGVFWFRDQVRNGGPWDYKQHNPGLQDFGNYNFGYTGAAIRFNLNLVLAEAGAAQVASGTSRTEWQRGGPPYGDDPRDQELIRQGYHDYQSRCYAR
jgi:RHS repeat-associated protein